MVKYSPVPRSTIVLCTLITMLAAACGGGGGGGGGGSPSLSYSGNTAPAVIDTENAAPLTAIVLGNELAGGITGSVGVSAHPRSSTSAKGIVPLARQLDRTFRDILPGLRSAGNAQSAAIPVNSVLPCETGGSVQISGTLQDNGTGTLSLTFSNCGVAEGTVSGSASMRVDVFDLGLSIPTDFTVSTQRLTAFGPGLSVEFSGSVRSQVSINAHTETITVNGVTRDNYTGRVTKAENLVFEDIYDNILSPASFTESLSGRVFHHVYGFVDVATTVPLTFSTLTHLFPNSGEMLLAGAGAGSIRVRAASETSTQLALDLNGDGVLENVAMLKWTDLSGPVGADLGDDDGDGVHNGWEAANGLNPHDPTDGAFDNDGDGVSNKGEYLAVTDPNNFASTPPSADLSITADGSAEVVAAGASLTYSITVANLSINAASNVQVTDTLPVGVNFVSASAAQGSCAGGSSLRCDLGTVDGSRSVSITIVVTATSEGTIINTASVTGFSSFDPDLTNNSATTTTTAGTAASTIQTLIDSASPGDTVLVDPRLYVGSVSFNGKDITLQSRGGPGTTIIHGNRGTAVQIGPGGSIKGFTITGAMLGIEANGAGSLISGNIFDGNGEDSIAFGVAIWGNSASPFIERNVFRNNSCDNQFISGVLSFVNSSSPQIINNIFENNECRAINLTLPTGNMPQVTNNTLVGNRTGIRVDRRVSQVTQTYRSNVIVQNGIGLEAEFGTDADNPVWQNNLVFGNATDYQGTASLTGSNGNISADPKFVSTSASDYRVQPGSPAIDVGWPAGAPVLDFAGVPRPLDGNGDGTAVVDMGAFEAPQIP